MIGKFEYDPYDHRLDKKRNKGYLLYALDCPNHRFCANCGDCFECYHFSKFKRKG